jgi:hypothetical protein
MSEFEVSLVMVFEESYFFLRSNEVFLALFSRFLSTIEL